MRQFIDKVFGGGKNSVEPAVNSFAVDEVEAAVSPVWSEPLDEHLAKRFQRKVFLLPQAGKLVINVAADAVLNNPKLSHLAPQLVNRVNPFIDALHTAFSQHRSLTISPDAIWMILEQGFTHHVSENAEVLRPRLVRHEGKVELSVGVAATDDASIQQAIASFSAQIREATDPVLHETLVCDFSTTTPAIRTASEVVLMDCYSSYFSYSMGCICGIPKITLTGQLQDWQRIRARIEVLATFGLEWWVQRLRPILDEFVETAEGRPNRVFWQAIYKPKQAYGDSAVTGWIADLFPYLGDAPKRRRNHVFNNERKDWAVLLAQGVAAGVGMRSFPSGLASAPVKLVRWPDGRLEADFVGGFLGVEQDSKDLALSPMIGWCMAEKAPSRPIRSY